MYRFIILLSISIPVNICAQSFEVILSTSFRVAADSKSKVILRVRPGDKGEVINSEKWWTKVIFNGREGFIKTSKLRITTNQSVASTPVKKPVVQKNETPSTQPIVKIHEKANTTDLAKAKASWELEEKKRIQEVRDSHQEEVNALIIERNTLVDELEKTKVRLSLQDQQLKAIFQDLDSTKNIITSLPTRSKLFRSLLDIKGGLASWIEDDYQEVSNGINLEIQYSFLSKIGLGFEVGVNTVRLSELEGFDPFINPFVGVLIGKNDQSIGFTFGPRIYYFMNPSYELEVNNEDVSTKTTISPGLMYGGGANLKFKLRKKVALSIYGNYMTGDVELNETGIKSGEYFDNVTKNKLHMIGVGLGLSFKL